MEKDINVDSEARKFMMQRGVSGVPSFLIGEEMVVGLDKEKVLALVDHRLVACEKCGSKMRLPINKGKLKVTCPKCQHKFETIT